MLLSRQEMQIANISHVIKNDKLRDEFLRLYNSGNNLHKISKMIGYSYPTVRGWATKLGLETVPYPKIKLDNAARAVRSMLSRKRANCKQTGVEFDLCAEDLGALPTHCPILGIELYYYDQSDGQNIGLKPYCASIDRIDPDKGYIKGNVQIMSHKANLMKNSASIEELKTFCLNMLKHLGVQVGV